ncbi:hypothetical protein L6452_34957 [Arctium lappa]|uniref:Uncharacterized protein n=1 Tax=Arctium lappa TaxID=4217 RepID=A0ACB8YJP2_ARCLA|nr:hypothetical protein L6452_34957 [Arctium lappa]
MGHALSNAVQARYSVSSSSIGEKQRSILFVYPKLEIHLQRLISLSISITATEQTLTRPPPSLSSTVKKTQETRLNFEASSKRKKLNSLTSKCNFILKMDKMLNRSSHTQSRLDIQFPHPASAKNGDRYSLYTRNSKFTVED